MRSMLVRAAEIRDSEQQQVFDALDEIHARLAPLESLGSVRKRMSELPDRTEVGVLAERLDETLAKLEAQDGAISGLSRAVEAIVDRLAKPFAELGGKLDGVSGRFEGVAGRMDGLEDRVAGLHKRIDDLDHHLDKQDGRVDGLPSSVHGPVRERLEALEAALRGRLDETDERLDGARDSLQRSLGEATDGLATTLGEAREAVDSGHQAMQGQFASTRDELSGAIDAQTTQLDDAERLEALNQRLEQLGDRLEGVSSRLDALEDGVGSRIGELAGSVDKQLGEIGGTVTERPDADALKALVRRANEESELRHAGQLDEAMATFAELILGGPPTQQQAPPPPPPRPAQRRTRKTSKARDSESGSDSADDSEGTAAAS
ncbi:MAG: PA containing protein [Pseudonocardiaceae bacterium]|nr:PA containing protein [Pseudonocardiaceae bacterium]